MKSCSDLDAPLLVEAFAAAHHGEKVSIAFFLNVWNPGNEWKAGEFDVLDALGIWNISKRTAFCDWTRPPWGPLSLFPGENTAKALRKLSGATS